MRLTKLRNALHDWLFVFTSRPTVRSAMLAELEMAEAAIRYCQARDEWTIAFLDSASNDESIREADKKYEAAWQAWQVARDATAKFRSNQ